MLKELDEKYPLFVKDGEINGAIVAFIVFERVEQLQKLAIDDAVHGACDNPTGRRILP